MKRTQIVCAAAATAILIVSSAGQAAMALATGTLTAQGLSFSSPDAYHLYYWSGVYADALDDGAWAFDNKYDPFDGPWENVEALTATATSGGATGTAMIRSGEAQAVGGASLPYGHTYAEGYADFEHWIDFETSDPTNTIGVDYSLHLQLSTNTPEETAYANMLFWADLDEWQDDDGDTLIDDDEWYMIDTVPFFDSDIIGGANSVDRLTTDTYWFDSFGPGVYSLGLYGWADAGVESTVPAPGALLLGALGGGLVGWLRRRRTL